MKYHVQFKIIYNFERAAALGENKVNNLLSTHSRFLSVIHRIITVAL